MEKSLNMKVNKLKTRDLFFVALYGVKARRGRAAMTSIGIGIGIAAIVAVTGISSSGKADLLATLESFGTNLIKASPQAGFFGSQESLPVGVVGMVERIGPVEEVTSTSRANLLVRRTNFISEYEGGGISTVVTSNELLEVIGGNLSEGRFIEGDLSDVPVTVLGAVSAERLGIKSIYPPAKILIDDQWFGVIGILEELTIHPDLDRSVFIGYGVAKTLFDIDSEPTTLYLRANPDYVEDVV
ncbi:MAG: ABC transporter permease, partial [Candidatus Actinomarina sp.]